jgi:hypothetical protein
MNQKIEIKNGRYIIPGHGSLPRVTSICGLLDKSRPLVGWASRVVAEYALKEIIEKLKWGELTIDQIEKMDVDQFVKDAKSSPRLIKEREAEKGKRVHKFAELMFKALIMGRLVDLEVDEDIEKPCQALIQFVEDHHIEPIAVEKTVWSKSFGGYAGRLDVVSWKDDKLFVIDLKTAKGLYDDHPLQIAAYYHAFKQMHDNEPIDGAAVLRLDKVSGFPFWHEYTPKQMDDYVDEFSFWCAIWHIRNDRRIREKEKKKKAAAKKKTTKKKTTKKTTKKKTQQAELPDAWEGEAPY